MLYLAKHSESNYNSYIIVTEIFFFNEKIMNNLNNRSEDISPSIFVWVNKIEYKKNQLTDMDGRIHKFSAPSNRSYRTE